MNLGEGTTLLAIARNADEPSDVAIAGTEEAGAEPDATAPENTGLDGTVVDDTALDNTAAPEN
jgi:DNA gyrase subunit A